ncbi:hypothetical protein RISK_001397 [Rhodopirellula islandica]|uniref:Uncharacterized protein n=1 Tax=Rhodopirellula islandica TaxID=595434 RepID=A0A0J1BJE8_RHOIS|nr:hypothetical protein RISK_001397 [Rhodopirellula islandica]
MDVLLGIDFVVGNCVMQVEESVRHAWMSGWEAACEELAKSSYRSVTEAL